MKVIADTSDRSIEDPVMIEHNLDPLKLEAKSGESGVLPASRAPPAGRLAGPLGRRGRKPKLLNEDYNGAEQEGVGYFQQTAYRGFRWSTAKSFLRPAKKRPNLRVLTKAQATGLILEGKRVTGLQYRQGGQQRSAMASAEVILSAGAINSPQILQCSGIGDPEQLQAAGVETLHALPGVGKNLNVRDVNPGNRMHDHGLLSGNNPGIHR